MVLVNVNPPKLWTKLCTNEVPKKANIIDLSGTESRIANRTIPKIAGPELPEITQREAEYGSNRSKVESGKIDSESPSESQSTN